MMHETRLFFIRVSGKNCSSWVSSQLQDQGARCYVRIGGESSLSARSAAEPQLVAFAQIGRELLQRIEIMDTHKPTPDCN